MLSPFSTQHIPVNFQFYRCRSAEQTVRSPGVWLYAATTGGYSLRGSSTGEPEGGPEGSGSTAPGSLPPLEHEGLTDRPAHCPNPSLLSLLVDLLLPMLLSEQTTA